jgi:hypothetical protein
MILSVLQDQGLDYEKILDQIAAEADEMKARGIWIERRALNRGEGDPHTPPSGPARPW